MSIPQRGNNNTIWEERKKEKKLHHFERCALLSDKPLYTSSENGVVMHVSTIIKQGSSLPQKYALKLM